MFCALTSKWIVAIFSADIGTAYRKRNKKGQRQNNSTNITNNCFFLYKERGGFEIRLFRAGVVTHFTWYCENVAKKQQKV